MGYEEIVSAVRIDGGVKRLQMVTIKELAAPYRERLSTALSHEITDKLNHLGVLTLPTTLPTDERAWAVLIIEKSPLGEAVSLATKAVRCSELDTPMAPGAHTKFRKFARQITKR
ncbi:hypothetical protein J7E88_08710 [Streptomyces sp. ISL-10]|uniref:hypothetical protein n=1 Tax=Streptomyces sp. ISL-10 TaxID=2819172 RepID=UPI001BEA49FA|nr:hypothetical protein [Streptomyces sp. ISL-10]MBT2365401.1 hypothetical protein [Streptomyces sp. ISL-10]